MQTDSICINLKQSIWWRQWVLFIAFFLRKMDLMTVCKYNPHVMIEYEYKRPNKIAISFDSWKTSQAMHVNTAQKRNTQSMEFSREFALLTKTHNWYCSESFYMLSSIKVIGVAKFRCESLDILLLCWYENMSLFIYTALVIFK